MTREETKEGGSAVQRKKTRDESTQNVYASQQKAIPLSTMFNETRLKRPLQYGLILLYILYFPLGCLLMLFRLSLFVVFCVVTCVCPSVGNFAWYHLYPLILCNMVVYENPEARPADSKMPRVVITNHTLDHDLVYLRSFVFKRGVLIRNDHYDDGWVGRFLGPALQNLGFISVNNDVHNKPKIDARALIRQRIIDENNLLLFCPEGGITTGRSGLLRFHQFVFSLGESVLPVILTHDTEHMPYHLDRIGTTFLTNLLFTYYTPFHRQRVRFLPPQSIMPGETAEEFADRMQVLMAREMGIEPTTYWYKDKVEYKHNVLHLH